MKGHTIIGIAGTLLLFTAGFLLGRQCRVRSHIEDVLEKVVVDTVYIERPQATRVEVQSVRLNIPRLVFVESSTRNAQNLPQNDNLFASDVDSGNLSEILTGSADSVALLVDVETHIYEDSLYRAQVSGPTLGGLHPSLDWVEVYNRTQYVSQTVTKRNRFGVGVQLGYGVTIQNSSLRPSPYIGVGIQYNLWSF